MKIGYPEKGVTTRPYVSRRDMRMTPALIKAGYRPSDALLEREGYKGILEQRRRVELARNERRDSWAAFGRPG